MRLPLLVSLCAAAACAELPLGTEAVESVQLSSERVALSLGESAQLRSTVLDADGRPLPDRPVHWGSDDPQVVVVSPTGIVTAVGTGTTRVTAESGGRSARAVVVVRASFVDVGVALFHSCAVTAEGRAACWGSNLWGKLGNGTLFSGAAPQLVEGAVTVTVVAAGGEHTCALVVGGTAHCWGANWSGQLGIGTEDLLQHPTPAPVATPLRFTALSAGDRHSCGLTGDGVAYCWGGGISGQLGSGVPPSRCAAIPEPCATTPHPVEAPTALASLSAGAEHTCAVSPDGTAYCWGRNHGGQLGDSTTGDRDVPRPVSGGITFRSVSAGGEHSCGVASDSTAYCWGVNTNGRLGDGTTAPSHVPVQVTGGFAFALVDAGDAHTCGITGDGAAYCWGPNRTGQLGDGTTETRTVPTPVAGGLTFVALRAGLAHSCGLTTDGTLYCWGWNASGQLGTGPGPSRRVPTPVVGQR